MSFLRAGQWGPEALIDGRGTPQPGAKLTLYEADGLTLATRWADAAKSAVAANPWPADGGGNALLFAEPGPHVLAATIGGVRTQIDIMVPIDPSEAQTDVDTDVAEEAAIRAAADVALAAAMAAAQGGATVTAAVLIEWTQAEAYQAEAITYDGTHTSTVSTATLLWPDGSAGVFTTDAINAGFETVDAYHVTHVASGKTVTQAAVTRNAIGVVTVAPALVVA